jgi:hypothetical protein
LYGGPSLSIVDRHFLFEEYDEGRSNGGEGVVVVVSGHFNDENLSAELDVLA